MDSKQSGRALGRSHRQAITAGSCRLQQPVVAVCGTHRMEHTKDTSLGAKGLIQMLLQVPKSVTHTAHWLQFEFTGAHVVTWGPIEVASTGAKRSTVQLTMSVHNNMASAHSAMRPSAADVHCDSLLVFPDAFLPSTSGHQHP